MTTGARRQPRRPLRSGRDAERVQMEVIDTAGTTRLLDVRPLAQHDIPANWYI